MPSVVVSLVFALRSAARSRAALHLEILALRHQLAVLNRSRPPRLRLTAADRLLWAWLSQAWSGWRPALVLVKPATVLAWHRRGFRLFWTWKSRHRTGRPPRRARFARLIRQCSPANPLWGAPRIHGELQKLGIAVSQATVAKYMPAAEPRHLTAWRTFLANHVGQIMAADFFVVPTVTFRLLVRPRHPRARPATHRPRCRHRPSDGRMDGATTPRTPFRGPRAPLSAARSRCRVHRRRSTIGGDAASTRSSRRRDRRGRTPTSSASSARSDGSASIT